MWRHGQSYSDSCYCFFNSLAEMAERRLSRLAERKDAARSSENPPIEDISSTSDSGWNSTGLDYKMGTHESDVSS